MLGNQSDTVKYMFFLLMYWHPQNWYVGPSMVSDEDLDKL